MKNLVGLALVGVLAACGSSTTPDDAGSDGAAQDGVANDSGAGDSSSGDAANDSGSDASSGGDGGLGSGELCDPQNNQCKPGLLCCSEPTHNGDASTAFFCEQPTNNACPLLP